MALRMPMKAAASREITGLPSILFAPFKRHLSQSTEEKSTSFGFKVVSEEEKAGLVSSVFANVAPSYDVMNDLMSGGLHRLWKDRLVAKLHPFPGMQHLDVAGGTGDVAHRIRGMLERACTESSHAHSDAPQDMGLQKSTAFLLCKILDISLTTISLIKDRSRVTVCDFNAEMIEQGKTRHGRVDIKWVVGDAQALPFSDNSMDGYTIAFGLRNVTHIRQALREAYRVLKPGGQFHCLEFSAVSIPVLRELYDIYSFNVIPRLGRFVADDEESYRYLVESIRKFPKQQELRQWIKDAHFSCVNYENLSGGIVAIHSAHKFM